MLSIYRPMVATTTCKCPTEMNMDPPHVQPHRQKMSMKAWVRWLSISFNIRSTDAIYFFVYWISLIWFFYLDFSYWTVLLDFDYHHVLDLGTFEKTAWILIPERPFLISFSALVHSPTRWDFAYWISFIGFSYLISLIGLSYWISLIWLSYWISPTIFISRHTMDVGSWVGGIAP